MECDPCVIIARDEEPIITLCTHEIQEQFAQK
jgi:hypothetical protein